MKTWTSRPQDQQKLDTCFHSAAARGTSCLVPQMLIHLHDWAILSLPASPCFSTSFATYLVSITPSFFFFVTLTLLDTISSQYSP